MDQLLQIHTVPIKIEISVTHAKVDISSQQASFNLTRNRGALSIDHAYPKLSIDCAAMRSSMNQKSPLELTRDFAQQGIQAARDATARTAEERYAYLATQNKNAKPVCEMARSHIQHNVQLVSASIPSVRPQINWEPQQLKMQYEKDRLVYDWRANHPEINATPGSVEFRVSQYPKTEITYIGRPIYVPPSADPEYEGDEQTAGEKPRFEATA